MQLLARFSFDGAAIILQSIDVLPVHLVGMLQLVVFLAQLKHFRALLTIDHHAVGAEGHVHK